MYNNTFGRAYISARNKSLCDNKDLWQKKRLSSSRGLPRSSSLFSKAFESATLFLLILFIVFVLSVVGEIGYEQDNLSYYGEVEDD
jgi:hypothetical protein